MQLARAQATGRIIAPVGARRAAVVAKVRAQPGSQPQFCRVWLRGGGSQR
jgi:hypothetical protein